MDILYAILIGLVTGVIAKFLMPGRDPGGFVITTIIGISGAILAKLIGQSLGWYEAGESVGFVAAIVGAILLLFLYRTIRGRRGG